MKIAVSTGNSRMDKKWNLTEMELEDFRERISKTQRTAETMEQYRKMKKSQQDDIKDVGGFVLGRLKGGRRKKDWCNLQIRFDVRYGLCSCRYWGSVGIVFFISMLSVIPPINIHRKNRDFV